jgi:hypothetical protein
MAKRKEPPKCQWLTKNQALTSFVTHVAGTQSAEHIRPLHWYVACRLVIECGFRPDEVRPRPPFDINKQGNRWILEFSDSYGGGEERTVLGGLKTKNVDVVVTKDGVGPVLAVSMKGTLNALRNLTNRMEEAVGDCTNLHISYPALVYGFLHVLKANYEAEGVPSNDISICADGSIVEGIKRYHDVMSRLAGRNDIRDVATKYEAVCISLVDTRDGAVGEFVADFPREDSVLSFGQFFERLYEQYDQRFVYAAPGLASRTRRLEWDADSPAIQDPRIADYSPRIRRG